MRRNFQQLRLNDDFYLMKMKVKIILKSVTLLLSLKLLRIFHSQSALIPMVGAYFFGLMLFLKIANLDTNFIRHELNYFEVLAILDNTNNKNQVESKTNRQKLKPKLSEKARELWNKIKLEVEKRAKVINRAIEIQEENEK